ncbi:uncharacterized protein N7479_003643 [Penicillium vulpinum]|uniref:ABC multidrug transporter MDR2 n=1 Tax=Penicillium vulpinum TaxID=29845 RepID=A0A1V6R9A3_9EURO|nr:uncharacterized protein N7479_003643 [Penicillium vulpinum]KAJ5963767.1 hypothetical protein N7479_003643 [Penicillium vulpinum]OQD97863.1 hypothetical protein PENVUL_c080G02577 [Penicillium vulpinum]
MGFGNLADYPRLLVAANPSRLELGTLFVGLASAIGSGVPFPIIGIIFGQLIDDFNAVSCAESENSSGGDSSDQSDMNSKILMIVYLGIAQFVLIYLHLLCWTMTGARLAQRLREKYLQNLLRQEPSFFDNLPAGEVASRLNTDIQTIRSGTAEKVGICISSFSFFVTAYIVAFIKDSILAAMLLSLIPAYFIMSFVGSYYIEKYTGRMSDYAASAASIASEALNNIVVVHAFGANGRLEKKFSKALKDSETEGLKKANATGIQAGVLYFVAYGANGLAFWQGSKQIANAVRTESAGATVGAVFTVIFVLVEATLLLSQVAPFIHLFTQAVACYHKLRDDMDRQSLIDGYSEEGIRLTEAEGGFELKNVSFIYPSRPEITVLNKINLSIAPKKHTAIVGLSGSGKSTIAGLVIRLYDATEGEITFDGHNLRDLNTRDLRGFLSLVQQEPSLLDRSLLENIAHGLMNSSKPAHAHLKTALLGTDLSDLATEVRDGQDLMAAAEKRGPEIVEIVQLARHAAALADADGFIEALQYGYATMVGSSGRLISGGQKQRVSLARALIKDPAVLILDEATAALDSRSEQRIQRAINNISTGRTVITIAHRLSTITNADKIVCMHKGDILEEGTHAELMAGNGPYSELVKLQTLGAAAASGKSATTASIDSISKSDDTSVTDVENEKGSISNDLEPTKATRVTTVSTTGAPPSNSGEEEEELETPVKSVWALCKGYAPALKPHLLVIFAALFGSSMVGGAFSGEAVIFGNTVGSLNPCHSAESISDRGNFYGLMFFVLAIIEFFANIVSWGGFGLISEKIVYKVRVLSFRSLFEQDLQWHQSKGRSPALLLSYITRDGNALAGISGSVIGTLFSISVNLVAAIILTHIIAWRIALVCLALVPLLLGAGLMELMILGKFEERHENAYTKSVDIGVEAVTSIKTVASLSLEENTLQTYRRSLQGPRKETFKVTVQASFWQAMTYFLGNMVNALAYWWGSKQIVNGNYTQTQFLIVVFSLLVSALLWSQMFALAPELSAARSAMSRILGLIEIGQDKMNARLTPPDENDIEATQEKPTYNSGSTASSVQLRDVHFSYPARPDMQVLKGLNVDIRPGKFCALVGPSGAGKSTIISLVERLYTPENGSIVIDGVDVTKTSDVSFRDWISLVPQDSVLFEGSIEFNVGLGARPGHNVTIEEIQEACKLANIHDVITALPDGYQTLCGPGGNQFSGGQKQRLSIARALVRKPKLLILDESTSALDAESEKLLQDGLEKAARGITVIAIAHRLHTIRKADVIFLIDGGVCTDSGSHEELLERSDSYRANVMHQTVAT